MADSDPELSPRRILYEEPADWLASTIVLGALLVSALATYLSGLL